MPASGFEHRLPRCRIPLHRRPEARVEIGLARRQHAEFQRAAAYPPLNDRPALEILGEAPAVLVAAAVDDDDPVGRRRARPDRLEPAAVRRRIAVPGPCADIGHPERRAVHNPERWLPCSISAISTENSPLRAMNSFVPSSGSTHQNRAAGDENPSAGTVSSETIGMSGTAAPGSR